MSLVIGNSARASVLFQSKFELIALEVWAHFTVATQACA